MSEWLKSLLGYMLIVSVTMQMLPNQKYEQYVRLFTGFLLIILILQPVLKIGSADSFLEHKISEFVQEQEALEERIGKEGEAFRSESSKYQEKISDELSETIEIQEITQVEVSIGD